MVEAKVSLYLVSRARLALLEKTVAFVALPRLREHVKFRNRELGDYFAFTVLQITHREGSLPELCLHSMSSIKGRSVVDFFQDAELEEYIKSYEVEGWVMKSLLPNRSIGEDGESEWSELLPEGE
jgi:hypothetical protein